MDKPKGKSRSKAVSKPDLKVVKDIPKALLTSEEYEALTTANYAHPESRLILRLFLHVNYYWHVSQFMQGKASSIGSVDWQALESSGAALITSTFEQLLPGVQTAPWSQAIDEKKAKPQRKADKQANRR